MAISFDRILKGVVSVLLMLGACVAVFARIMLISEWEMNYARRPSVSSAEAAVNGTLLRRLPTGADGPALGFVAVLDRTQANLALLRFKLLDAEHLLV